jgi:isochorismate hydrolase
MQIAEMQQYLSSYYDSTQYVMQQAAKQKQQLKQEDKL